jgi:hypothetical protein
MPMKYFSVVALTSSIAILVSSVLLSGVYLSSQSAFSNNFLHAAYAADDKVKDNKKSTEGGDKDQKSLKVR